jgi:hypothetical protein
VLFAPGILAVDSLLSMNAFEPLFWMGCVLVMVRFCARLRLWLWFGVLRDSDWKTSLDGLLRPGFAALLCPSPRVSQAVIWIAGAIAFALFLTICSGRSSITFRRSRTCKTYGGKGKNVVLGPLAFTIQQIVNMHRFFSRCG